MTSRRAPGASVEAYRADTDLLTDFVDRGRGYRLDLEAILAQLRLARRRILAVVGDGPPALGAEALGQLLDAAEASTLLADSVRRDLLEVAVEGVRPVLRRAVLDGRLPAPDDARRDRVLAAIVEGLGPADVGIDAAYFPAVLVRHRTLSQQIEELEAERDRADGLPLVWWDDDEPALADLDARLVALRERRAALSEHGVEADGTIEPLDAVALVAEATGGLGWEGRAYAEAFIEHRRRALAGVGPQPGEVATIVDPTGFVAEFEHLAERVEGDAEVAVAFYRELGPVATADLPTFVLAADGDRRRLGDAEPVVAQLARGLASATHLRSAGRGGRGTIGFDGGDLLVGPRPATAAGVIGHSPAHLFTVGRFEDGFLAEATVAALRLGAVGDPRGHVGRFGWRRPSAGLGSTTPVDPGVDPRNLLLDRAAERPETARLVVERLATGSDPGGSASPPTAEALDPLVGPSVPFPPAIHPELAPYPITSFLAAAATDGRSSARILRATAQRVTTTPAGGSAVGDPGTAAGLDLLLGVNASMMVGEDDLRAVGLSAAAVDPGRGRPIGEAEVRAVVGEVRRWGRGEALAAATIELTARAIAGAIDADGRLHVDRVRPFAHLAGRAEAEAHEARLAAAVQLDDEARAWNRQASRTVALATTALGFVPTIGSLSIPAGLGWTFLFDGRPTEAELQEYRHRWAAHYEAGMAHPWTAAVAEGWLQWALAEADATTTDVIVPGRGRRQVEVRRTEHRGRYRWRDPDTGVWTILDTGVESDVLRLAPHASGVPLRLAIDGVIEIDEDFRDGIMARRLAGAGAGASPTGDDREATDDAGWTDRWLGDR